jgi:transmembrane protein TMEM260 (protein O-mannosyltransferase)
VVTRSSAVAAAAVALAAFFLYHATLLPSLDFGDTPSFQATVGSPVVTARDGYPLYFAIGEVVLRATGVEPARALNLASAVEASVACGVTAVIAVHLSGSVIAGVAAALLFGVSYTFWSQAIIAEVYALHLLFVSLTLLLLLRWAAHPTLQRLALFLAVYALGFGNHLSMILLAPGYAAFLLMAAPGGWRSILTARVALLAVGVAALGALQYGPELRSLWLMPQPPHGIADGLQHFWFDVTKSDWRDTMVANVPRSIFSDRFAMYVFDLRQQFGIAGIAAAALGVVELARRDWRRLVLLLMLYGANALFAFTYNVGDAHVFYLPSHFVVALLAGCSAALVGRAAPAANSTCAALLLAYAVGRGYHDYPALDRSADTRPADTLARLTKGLDDRQSILIADLNWQIQNGLTYFAKVTRPEIAYTRAADVLLFAPALVADNHAIGREVAATERARAMLAAAYGPELPSVPDPRVPVTDVASAVADLAPGTRYVICVLRPSRDLTLDANDLSQALQTLAGGRPVSPVAGSDYVAIAGLVGEPPAYIAAASRPFHRSVTLGGVPVELRMESWLAADTIRRMGFGHVIAARQHTLVVERGVSFVAFDERGDALQTAYASNIFAPQRRYLVSIAR